MPSAMNAGAPNAVYRYAECRGAENEANALIYFSQFHPVLKFVGKARSLPCEWSSVRGLLGWESALLANIKLERLSLASFSTIF
jgi:hypothetical protein